MNHFPCCVKAQKDIEAKSSWLHFFFDESSGDCIKEHVHSSWPRPMETGMGSHGMKHHLLWLLREFQKVLDVSLDLSYLAPPFEGARFLL
ncbi:hypothetical protein [Desulfosoma sp.]|uniref:hypothetical protein n=1 Tax=Desulfosoma sp. TaxID=2603217 RepID=UPI00404A64BB